MNPVKIFISYAKEDRELMHDLRKHLHILEEKYPVTVWDEDNVLPGNELEQNLNQAMQKADVILLLISIDFLTTESCYQKQLSEALRLNKQNKIKVVSVLLRHCNWELTPVSNLTLLPENKIPVYDNYWSNPDQAFTEIVKGLENSIFKEKQTYQKQTQQNKTYQQQTAPPAQPANAPESDIQQQLIDEELLFNQYIDKANNLMKTNKCSAAIEKYKLALQHYHRGFRPSETQINEQIQLCEQKTKFDSLMSKGVDAYEEEDYEKALTYFSQAEKLQNSPTLLHLKEQCQEKIKNKPKQKTLSLQQQLSAMHPNSKIAIAALLLIAFIISLLLIFSPPAGHTVNKALKETSEYRQNDIYIDNDTHEYYAGLLMNIYQSKKTDEIDKRKLQIALYEVNDIYIEHKLQKADKALRNYNFQQALDSLKSLDIKLITKQQQEQINDKILEVAEAYSQYTLKKTDRYLEQRKYNNEIHPLLIKELEQLLTEPAVPEPQKQEISKKYREINDLLIAYYIENANYLVKNNNPWLALQNLKKLQKKSSHFTKSQRNTLNKKISDISSFIQVMQKFN